MWTNIDILMLIYILGNISRLVSSSEIRRWTLRIFQAILAITYHHGTLQFTHDKSDIPITSVYNFVTLGKSEICCWIYYVGCRAVLLQCGSAYQIDLSLSTSYTSSKHPYAGDKEPCYEGSYRARELVFPSLCHIIIRSDKCMGYH